jgi:hypothetical protein
MIVILTYRRHKPLDLNLETLRQISLLTELCCSPYRTIFNNNFNELTFLYFVLVLGLDKRRFEKRIFY